MIYACMILLVGRELDFDECLEGSTLREPDSVHGTHRL